MRRFLFAVLLLFSVSMYGQHTITGIVLDSLTQEPLPSATVYVNGTTLGTATDADGRFELKGVSLPATVVFSFVGYQTQAIELNRYPESLTISLKTNDELPEVVVSGKKNMPNKEDLDYFKSFFLGDDKWSKQARILNEDALLFYRTTEFYNTLSEDEKILARRGYYNVKQIAGTYFKAWASEPLIIDLPSLGYEVYVDLVRFEVKREKAITTHDMLGYFYYKPYTKMSQRQARTIEENRMRAYYGSTQHFLRSLSEDRLTENGYTLSLLKEVKKGRKVISSYMPFNMKDHFIDTGGRTIQVRDLKDEDLRIRYYYKNDGSPWDFSTKGKGIRRYSESNIIFLHDTCTFSKTGIITDNNIRFKGEITKRKVASSLPDDYISPADTAQPVVTDYASELMKFADNIREFNSMFPQEKVYLEFDNTAYFQGENIWFKAFVTHASTLGRAPSGVLYVDFLAPTGELILQQKLKIEAGQTDGAIPLLDAGTFQTREKQGVLAYPSGFYEIRAYTQNMLDFSPDAIFSRVIPVYTQPKYVGEYDRSRVENNEGNPRLEKIRGETIEPKHKINVSFYPEGGDLVKGLPSRVAFKAIGSDGFGINGSLKVQGLADSVKTVHDGMGSFVFIPKGSESADFITSDGNGVSTGLPKAVSSGYSMISDMLPGSRMEVSIWRTEDRVGEQTALAVTCRGEVIYFKEIKDIDDTQFEIDCSDWPVGVCRLTLYNSEGMILSSRSIFNGEGELSTPAIQANTDSMSRQAFGKEVIEFQLTDQEGNPFRDRFCLSVRDATDYGGGRTENLQTNLLLSSDLRGYIHDPAWYLESDDNEHREALNLLTLVQGWERYEWQYMAGLKEFVERHRVEEGLTMNGWILSYGRREPVSDIGVYASVQPEEDKMMFESFDYQTDSTGYFGFDMSDFYGRGSFTINLMSTKANGNSKYERSKRIRFERADRPKVRPFLIQEIDLSHNKPIVDNYKVSYTDNDLTDEQRRRLGRMIDDVDIEETGGKRRFIDYDTFVSFEAEEDAELELDNGEYTTNLYGYFLDKGIRMDNSASLYHPFFYIHNMSKVLVHKPFDIPEQIDMIDVKSVIVFDRPMRPYEIDELTPLMSRWARSHVGMKPENTRLQMGQDGMEASDTINYWDWVAFSGERRTLVDIQVKEDQELLSYRDIRNLGRRTTTVKGFTKPVQFYSPEYPDGPILGSIDPRRTLYWNANVITDENGRARVEFYNNSFTRKFTINAAGITASGIPYILKQNW